MGEVIEKAGRGKQRERGNGERSLKQGQTKVLKILIVVEETPNGYSAFSPDVRGCVASGVTREGVESMIREVIEFHLRGLRALGEAVPAPHSYAMFVEVGA